MKISLKVEYACRVLAQLARRYGAPQLFHIDELADMEAVPANYLVQILNELRNGGLLISRRGKMGGYALAKAPGEVTLFDIIKVVDSDMLECQASTQGESGPAVRAAWTGVGKTLEDKLREITLEDFLSKGAANMYYI